MRVLPARPAASASADRGGALQPAGRRQALRPILALAACEAVGGDVDTVMPLACALEMIHTYSLIHDDLPAMDDDALRRGRPTTHIAFGEGLAILAGDALLTEAFAVLMRGRRARPPQPRRPCSAAREIAEAAGLRGMVGGQAADLAAEGQEADLPLVEFIHVRKTGALLLAAVRAGALVGGADDAQLRGLTRYGECLGLAFQIADDILDAEALAERDRQGAGPRRPAPQGDVSRPCSAAGREAARARAASTRRWRRCARFGARPTRCAAMVRFVVGRACGAGEQRERLDKVLVDRGYAASRERARGWSWPAPCASPIASSTRPGRWSPPTRRSASPAAISRTSAAAASSSPARSTRWRSTSPAGVVLDVGASTGGFTDCVLQRGARAVIAVDVGYGQLAWSLRQDPRVTLLERTNVRHLEPQRLPAGRPRRGRRLVHLAAIVLPGVPRCRRRDIVALVKPQFEVGKGQVGSGGVVRDPALHAPR